MLTSFWVSVRNFCFLNVVFSALQNSRQQHINALQTKVADCTKNLTWQLSLFFLHWTCGSSCEICQIQTSIDIFNQKNCTYLGFLVVFKCSAFVNSYLDCRFGIYAKNAIFHTETLWGNFLSFFPEHSERVLLLFTVATSFRKDHRKRIILIWKHTIEL